MKTKIFIPIVLLLLISCKEDNKEKLNSTEKTAFVDSSSIKKKEAIVILDKVNVLVKKGITNEMTNKKVNEEINPLMDNYFKLLSEMKASDSTEVENYRVKQINEIIDSKLQN